MNKNNDNTDNFHRAKRLAGVKRVNPHRSITQMLIITGACL